MALLEMLKVNKINLIVVISLMFFIFSCEDDTSTTEENTIKKVVDANIFDNETVATKVATVLYEIAIFSDGGFKKTNACKFDVESGLLGQDPFGKYTFKECVLDLNDGIDSYCTSEQITLNGTYYLYIKKIKNEIYNLKFQGSGTFSGYLNGTCYTEGFVLEFDFSNSEPVYTHKYGTLCGVKWSNILELADEDRGRKICE